MKMIVMTRGGLKSPCQHGACGMGDMKIPRETDDANDPDDSSGVWLCQHDAIPFVAKEAKVTDDTLETEEWC